MGSSGERGSGVGGLAGATEVPAATRSAAVIGLVRPSADSDPFALPIIPRSRLRCSQAFLPNCGILSTRLSTVSISPMQRATTITSTPGAFRAFKDAQGNWRWMTLTSNMWRDRDGEIIPAVAHEENVAHVESTKDMPELRLWHVPGSRVGVADWVDFAHGFLLHSGGFDKGMEDVAESLATCKEPLGVSHGFYYEKEEGSDTYTSYRDFEVSVLPLERAANPWTEFTADNMKEVAMGLSDERRGFLVEHTSEDVVTALEKLLEEKEQDLKDGKVDYKDVLVEAFEAAPAPDPKPAEGDGEAPKGIVAELAKITNLIGLQGKQVEELAAAAGEMGKAIKALQATDDAKIAAAIAPQRQPPPNGERPSESDKNEVDPKDKGIDPNEAGDGSKTPGAKALDQIARIL